MPLAPQGSYRAESTGVGVKQQHTTTGTPARPVLYPLPREHLEPAAGSLPMRGNRASRGRRFRLAGRQPSRRIAFVHTSQKTLRDISSIRADGKKLQETQGSLPDLSPDWGTRPA
jgi:hypothetical protein